VPKVAFRPFQTLTGRQFPVSTLPAKRLGERSWLGKVETSKAALRDEVSEHYSNAVEFRTVYPCMQAQLAQLRDRVLASGAVMVPAPIYQESGSDFVLRIPLSGRLEYLDLLNGQVIDYSKRRTCYRPREKLAL
jgi:hypothetical protein